MFMPFLYKITDFVVLNFSHFISQTCKFVNLVEICLYRNFKQSY